MPYPIQIRKSLYLLILNSKIGVSTVNSGVSLIIIIAPQIILESHFDKLFGEGCGYK